MKTKQQTIIENVRGAELPPAWAKQAVIAEDELVDVKIRRVQRKSRKPTLEEIMPLVREIQSHPIRNPHFRIEDLYDDKTGAPK